MNLSGKQEESRKVEGPWERILAWVERNLAIAAIVVWCIFTWIVSRKSDFATTGQFGDSFGTLNALFASLAAVAAFKAYWSQRQQLKDQQEEFRTQRHESHLFFLMEELRNAVRAVTFEDEIFNDHEVWQTTSFSGEAAVRQLENIFLGQLKVLPRDVVLVASSSTWFNVDGFMLKERLAIAARIDHNSNAAARDTNKRSRVLRVCSSTEQDLRYRVAADELPGLFSRFYESCAAAALGHVLRLQESILRFIDTRTIPEAVRCQHAELFKAQITDPELHLLLYYALSDLAGGDELRQIMVRYNILEALWRKKPEFIWHRIPEISYFETEASPS